MTSRTSVRTWSWPDHEDAVLVQWLADLLAGRTDPNAPEQPEALGVLVNDVNAAGGRRPVETIEVSLAAGDTVGVVAHKLREQLRTYLSAQLDDKVQAGLTIFARQRALSLTSGVVEFTPCTTLGEVKLHASATYTPVGLHRQGRAGPIIPPSEDPMPTPRSPNYADDEPQTFLAPDDAAGDEALGGGYPEGVKDDEDDGYEAGEDDGEGQDEEEEEEEEEDEEAEEEATYEADTPSRSRPPDFLNMAAPARTPRVQHGSQIERRPHPDRSLRAPDPRSPVQHYAAPPRTPANTVSLDALIQSGVGDPDRLFATMLGAGINDGVGLPPNMGMALMLMLREERQHTHETIDRLLMAVMNDRSHGRDEAVAKLGVDRELMLASVEAATNRARLEYEASSRERLESNLDRLSKEHAKAASKLTELEQERAKLLGKLQSKGPDSSAERALDMIGQLLQGAKQDARPVAQPEPQHATQQHEAQQQHGVRMVADPVPPQHAYAQAQPQPPVGGPGFAGLGAGIDAGLSVARGMADNGGMPDLATLGTMLSFASESQISDLLGKLVGGNQATLRRLVSVAEKKLVE